MQLKPILSTLTKKEKHIQCHEIHGQFHEIRVRVAKQRAGRTGSRACQWPLGQSSYAVSLGHFSYWDLTPATLSHSNTSVLNSDSWERKSNSLSLGQISVPSLSSPGQRHGVAYMVPMFVYEGPLQRKENGCE